MKYLKRILSSNKGFTIVETLVALIVVTILSACVLGITINTYKQNKNTSEHLYATNSMHSIMDIYQATNSKDDFVSALNSFYNTSNPVIVINDDLNGSQLDNGKLNLFFNGKFLFVYSNVTETTTTDYALSGSHNYSYIVSVDFSLVDEGETTQIKILQIEVSKITSVNNNQVQLSSIQKYIVPSIQTP